MIQPQSAPDLSNMPAWQKRNLLSQLIARREAAERGLPLSFGEERLWYLNEVEPGNRAYTMCAGARFIGALDVPLFSAAVNKIVRRHESLRTFYIAGTEAPLRAISASLTIEIPTIDLRKLSADEQRQFILCRASDDSLLSFNLSELPLFRIVLLRLDDNEYVTLSAIHHIIFDHWSTQVFHREVMAEYRAMRSNVESLLPELPIQLSDFASWQRKTIEGVRLQEHLEYWRNKLAGTTILELPTDRPRPSIKTYSAATTSQTLPADIAGNLKLQSQRHGVTMFMLYLTCFKILLHHYSQQSDIAVGIDIAGRNRPEAEPLIGFFVNELPLRTDLSGNPSFIELLERVRRTCLEAYAHQDAPFHEIVKLLPRARDLSRSPIFQTKFALARPGIPEGEWNELTIKSIELEPPATELDLTVFVEDTLDGSVATIQYNRDLFDGDTIALLMHRLDLVFREVAGGSNLRLDQFADRLSGISPAGRQQASPPRPRGQREIPGRRKPVSVGAGVLTCAAN